MGLLSGCCSDLLHVRAAGGGPLPQDTLGLCYVGPLLLVTWRAEPLAGNTGFLGTLISDVISSWIMN